MNHIDETTYELDMLLELATDDTALGSLQMDEDTNAGWSDIY